MELPCHSVEKGKLINYVSLLLKQADREVLERQLEHSRLLKTLQRIQESLCVVIDLDRATPLGFPLMVERVRNALGSEALTDRVKRMTMELERE